ncbi:hypothetical protein NMY22_g13472 [Coprinellus aureogranulatus]|nr:hypothetical protein NMY22_g13472 [Coprinellus aureogranulatus]
MAFYNTSSYRGNSIHNVCHQVIQAPKPPRKKKNVLPGQALGQRVGDELGPSASLFPLFFENNTYLDQAQHNEYRVYTISADDKDSSGGGGSEQMGSEQEDDFAEDLGPSLPKQRNDTIMSQKDADSADEEEVSQPDTPSRLGGSFENVDSPTIGQEGTVPIPGEPLQDGRLVGCVTRNNCDLKDLEDNRMPVGTGVIGEEDAGIPSGSDDEDEASGIVVLEEDFPRSDKLTLVPGPSEDSDHPTTGQEGAPAVLSTDLQVEATPTEFDGEPDFEEITKSELGDMRL